ncbi:hypothetical protein TrLO_g1458 [Triparma laevis f. longispina]|uniref:NAD(P)-binding protein n=1 Tax=Triparma laevis f. longispina TaxID=1714387 RepID=A0A9W7AZB8_9STRA|nr:hypothetical protein TrLO_g1458 [Triparma laevis f. longispina]
MSSKFALITGANRGLGFECVKTILRQTDPYHVLLCSRSVAAGEKAVASLPSSLSAPSRVSVIELDVTSPASITAAVASVKSLAPSLSVLVNNAGILEGEQTLSTNFDAVLAVTQAFMPLLADGSCITTTSSSCGTRFLASLPPQDASDLSSSELTVPELSAKITELSKKPSIEVYSLSKR